MKVKVQNYFRKTSRKVRHNGRRNIALLRSNIGTTSALLLLNFLVMMTIRLMSKFDPVNSSDDSNKHNNFRFFLQNASKNDTELVIT